MHACPTRTSTVCTEHVRAFIVRNLSPPPQPPRRALPLRTTSCTSARKRVVLDHLSPPRRADTTADMHIVGRRAHSRQPQIRMSACARLSTCTDLVMSLHTVCICACVRTPVLRARSGVDTPALSPALRLYRVACAASAWEHRDAEIGVDFFDRSQAARTKKLGPHKKAVSSS